MQEAVVDMDIKMARELVVMVEEEQEVYIQHLVLLVQMVWEAAVVVVDKWHHLLIRVLVEATVVLE